LTSGPITLVSRTLDGTIIEAIQGDITTLRVDAITNAANDHLWMGAGVAGAIKARGGNAIEREAMAKGPIPVGSAIETGAGELPAYYVIHGAVMGQDLKTDLSTVVMTTRSVLELADLLRVSSIALPLMGTGVGGLDLDEVASSMAGEVLRLSREGRCQAMRVLLVGYDDAAAAVIAAAVEGLRGW
jgi:O-acetyl-ADP-ribose deacetylase (regulator of RNase III)